jgi:hypothetical protein
MARSLLAILLLAFVVGALAGGKNSGNSPSSGTVTTCKNLLQARSQALNALTTASSLDNFAYAAAKAAINLDNNLLSASYTGGCCAITDVANYFAAHYATPFGSNTIVPNGPVCGYDFQTYSSPAAACAVGVYHAGACNFFLDANGNVEYVQGSTNLACYSIANPLARAQCVGNLATALYANVTFFYQPPDYVLAAQVQKCDPTNPAIVAYRQADGSCNNLGIDNTGKPLPLINPLTFQPYNPPVLPTYSGMAGNKFIHESSVLPTDPNEYLASGPNPREISIRLFTQTKKITPPVAVNALTFAWVNWFVHDFMNHDNSGWQDPYAIPLPVNDPYLGNPDNLVDVVDEALTGYGFQNGAEVYMLLQSTFPSGDSPTTGFPIRRNAATAWFDGSQVYGSNAQTLNSLRSFVNGQLLVGTNCAKPPCLPDAPPQLWVKNPFLTGDYRANFHPGLTALHTLWVREHNNIASLLAKNYPTLNDEQLFQTARLIVNAEMIKVHTLEWSNQMSIDFADNAVTNNLAAFFLSGGETPFEPNYPLITHATPEEFVAAYKWHSFVPPTINLVNAKNGSVIVPNVDYVAQFQDTTLIRTYGIENVLVSLGLGSPGAVRLNNLAPKLQTFTHPFVTPRFSNPFVQPTCVIAPIIDMAAMDIIRDRERGIPKYNDFRKLVALGQLPPAVYFDDIADTPATAAAMADVYKWDIDDVDAVVGMHGEKMNSNQAIPVTMLAAFIPFVVSRMVNDRFYNVNYNAQFYTQWGINRLKTVGFAQILCDNDVTCNVNPNAAFSLSGWTGIAGPPILTKTTQ